MASRVYTDLGIEDFYYLGQMTTAQRNSVAPAKEGAIVYDTDLNRLMVYNGTVWNVVGKSSAGVSADPDNALSTGTDGFPYFSNSSRYFNWTSGSMLVSPALRASNPRVYHYTGSFPGTLQIALNPRISRSDRTEYLFLFNTGSAPVTVRADSSLDMGYYGKTECAPNEVLLIRYGDAGHSARGFKISTTDYTSQSYLHVMPSVGGSMIWAPNSLLTLDAYFNGTKVTRGSNIDFMGGIVGLKPGTYRLTAYIGYDTISDYVEFQWADAFTGANVYGMTGIASGETGDYKTRTIAVPAVTTIRAQDYMALTLVNKMSTNVTLEKTAFSVLMVDQLS
ncbi:MAG: hypothetical protein D6698_16280 [Gammaproteobacteria bacterium]|nr:MAG: hypothetical protein D6698_16280 [Gammaproteobacteria bacterium]